MFVPDTVYSSPTFSHSGTAYLSFAMPPCKTAQPVPVAVPLTATLPSSFTEKETPSVFKLGFAFGSKFFPDTVFCIDLPYTLSPCTGFRVLSFRVIFSPLTVSITGETKDACAAVCKKPAAVNLCSEIAIEPSLNTSKALLRSSSDFPLPTANRASVSLLR